MNQSRPVLSLEQATHKAAKEEKGGIVAIAAAYGFNPDTFQKYLNPTQTGHPEHLAHFEAVLEYTQSPLILDALGRMTNTTWVALGQFGDVGDMAMLDSITQLVTRVGDMSRTVQESLADGRVDRNEYEELKRCLANLVAAGHAVVMRAEQYLDE